MKILGIDPGIGIVGFGCIESNGFKHRLVDAGVIKTVPNSELSSRLDVIFENLVELIEEIKPDVASVEKLFFAQNVTTAISVSHARGVILLALHRAGVPYAEYTPLQIKQAIVGYGHAEKHQVQEMVKNLLGLDVRPKPDDCADALAAALMYATTNIDTYNLINE